MHNDERETPKETKKRVPFTAVYDWLAKRTELSSSEKLIVAHILRFGKSGCYKSNNVFARDMGMHRVSFIHALKALVDKEWVAILYPSRRERILYINEEMLAELPLFEDVRGCGKPVKSSAHVSSETLPTGSSETLQVSSETLPPFNRKSKDLSYNSNEREKREILFAASTMKESVRTHLSDEEINRRKQKILKDLGR